MYDPGLAERLTEIMGGMLEMDVTYMFGGYGYLMNGNMCVGVWNDQLVIRIGVETAAAIADEPFVKDMDLTGRPMKGWAMVLPDGLSEDADLQRYVDLAIFFCASLPPNVKTPKTKNRTKKPVD